MSNRPWIGRLLRWLVWFVSGGMAVIATPGWAQSRECFEQIAPPAVPPKLESMTGLVAAPTSTYWLWTCADNVLPPSSRYALQPLIIVTDTQLWLIDPGATARVGTQLARDVYRRWRGYRVAIINSRAQPEGVLATDGFIRQWTLRVRGDHPGRGVALDVPVYAGPMTAALMKQRCPTCLKRLTLELGKASLLGTRIFVPNHTVQDGQGLPLNPGFIVTLTHEAAIEEDLMLTNPQQGLMWVGALVHPARVPDLQQGQLERRLAVLEQMRGFNGMVVSQFGVVSPEQIERSYRYLHTLKTMAQEQVEAGADAVGAFKAITQAPVWPNPISGDQVQIHELNVQRVIRAIEEQAFN